MRGLRKYPLEDMARALELCKGRVFSAAKLLGCSTATIYNYMNEHPELQEIQVEQHGLRGDIVESKLDEAVNRGEGWAVCFTLKTQYKDRGYVERIEQTGPNGGPIQVDLTEIKREKLTLAVQNGLNSGWNLRDTLEYLTMRGVSREDLALVKGEDLIMPVIDVTPDIHTNGHRNDADRGGSLVTSNGAGPK